MHKKEFMEKVREDANLRSLTRAEDLTKVVFYLLSARLTVNEGYDLRAQFPQDLKDVWDEVKEKEADLIKFKKPEFLRRVMLDGKLRSVGKAEKVVKIVFRLLKSQISGGESKDVAAQLPKGLKEMWIKA